MKLKLFGLSALLVLCLAATAPAGQSAPAGDKKGQNISDQKAASSESAAAVSNNALASRLAVYARQAKSPMALAAAAQIFATSALEDVKKAKTDENGAAVPAVPGEKAPDAQALFAEALAMAKEQQNLALADLIDKQAKASGQTKGRAGGAARHIDTVLAGKTDMYRVTFRGGESARVAAVADGNQDIDIHIYDENGNFITKDDAFDSTPICAWTPKWTGEFTIKVKNNEKSSVRYILMTN